MTKPIVFRVVLGVVAIFLAGAVAGAFLGARFQLETQTKRAEIGNLSGNVMEMLEERLSLTPAQSRTFDPLVKRACEELRDVYQSSSAQVHQIMGRYYQLMAKDLDPEKAEILKAMESELREKAKLDSNRK